jgi:hypothetical protein
MTAAPSIPEPVELVPDTEPTVELPTVELRGRRFHVREQGVSLLSLMRFATIAKKGLRTEDVEGLVALYELLQQCVHPDEWDAFEQHASQAGAGGEELIGVVRDAVQAAAKRPTQPPPGSPGGRSTIAPSSAGGSSAPGSSIRQGDPRVQAALEQRGRPDLALVVKRAGEASTTS